MTTLSVSRAIRGSLLLLGAACAPARDTATTDSTPGTSALPPIDTLKVATDSMPPRDTTSIPRATTPGVVPRTETKVGTKAAPVATKTKTKSDSIIGYDKVTPLDPTKKRLDTVTKRPPR
jgi:hypothetical protein